MTVEVILYAFIRDDGSEVVFAATQVDTMEDIYISVDPATATAWVRYLDYEESQYRTVEIEPSQIIGKIPVPWQLTKLRFNR